MTIPSYTKLLQMRCCDDLMRIRPQDSSGHNRPLFNDRLAKVFDQPCQISRLRDKSPRCGTKPAHTADFGFLVWSVEHLLRFAQVVVKPIQELAHVVHLPRAVQIVAIIPNVVGGTKQALVGPGTIVPDARFKSDVHMRILRKTQTFLGKLKTEFDCDEYAMRFSSEFSLLCLQRNTRRSHNIIAKCIWPTGKFLPSKPHQPKQIG